MAAVMQDMLRLVLWHFALRGTAFHLKFYERSSKGYKMFKNPEVSVPLHYYICAFSQGAEKVPFVTTIALCHTNYGKCVKRCALLSKIMLKLSSLYRNYIKYFYIFKWHKQGAVVTTITTPQECSGAEVQRHAGQANGRL